MKKKETTLVPTHARLLSWEQAFIRLGFCFTKQGDVFDFSQESRENQAFLLRILQGLHAADDMKPWMHFTPSTQTVEESGMMDAFVKARGCRDDFVGDVNRVILSALDPYIAGIVRWMNAIGIKTTLSCDGHGVRRPTLHFERDLPYAYACKSILELLSAGMWSLHQEVGQDFGRLVQRQYDPERRRYQVGHTEGEAPIWLLDVAEVLYTKQEEIKPLVCMMLSVGEETYKKEREQQEMRRANERLLPRRSIARVGRARN